MKYIQLTQGYVALVDDAEYEWLSQYKWQYQNGYARNRKLGYMHRLIIDRDNAGGPVDHVNGSKLDNRLENLRRASVSQNAMNKRVRYDSISGYKGVELRRDAKRKKPYRARIDTKYGYETIGHYATAEEAALAYNEAAKRCYGEYARLNEVVV